MALLTLYPANTQTLTLVATNSVTGTAITGDTITATLYTQVGGVVDAANFQNLAFTETSTLGTYTATLPKAFNPSASLTGYVVYTGGSFTIRQAVRIDLRFA